MSATDNPGYFYGFGFGMGLFSSIFASAGLMVILGAWTNFCKEQNWTPSLLIPTLFQSLFGIPFFGVPLIIALTTGIWLVGLVGYSIPFSFAMCLIIGRNGNCDCRNPFHPNGHPHINQNDIEIQQPRIQQHSTPKNTSIWNWLKDIELLEYYQTFINEGYTSAKDLETLTTQDLHNLKITKHFHVKKIMEKVNKNKSNEGTLGALPIPIYKHNVAVEPGQAPPAYSSVLNQIKSSPSYQ